jgi:hypothetical protein
MKLKNTDLFCEAVADYDENLFGKIHGEDKTLLQKKKSTKH